MRDELLIDTQLLAVDSKLDDAHRALLRADRIPTVLAVELRTILASVAELDRPLAGEHGTVDAASWELDRLNRWISKRGAQARTVIEHSALHQLG